MKSIPKSGRGAKPYGSDSNLYPYPIKHNGDKYFRNTTGYPSVTPRIQGLCWAFCVEEESWQLK